jgi:hypothetical protein
MLSKHIVFTTMLALLTIASNAQRTEAMDKLRSSADEILLIEVSADSAHLFTENFRCYSSVFGNVVEILKSTKIPLDRKKVTVFRGAKCDDTGFPIAMKLPLGKQYFVFLSTQLVTDDEVRNDKANKIQFKVSDIYLGILPYNEDLYKYLRQSK